MLKKASNKKKKVDQMNVLSRHLAMKMIRFQSNIALMASIQVKL